MVLKLGYFGTRAEIPRTFQMWCWRLMEISYTGRVRNERVLRVQGERNILKTIKRRKANWIGHILRRNCLLKQVIEGKGRGKDGSDGKTKKKTYAFTR
jgi:hypothetical protein